MVRKGRGEEGYQFGPHLMFQFSEFECVKVCDVINVR